MAHDLRLTTFYGLMHLCYATAPAPYATISTFKLKAQLVKAFLVIVASFAAARTHLGLRLRLHIECILLIFCCCFLYALCVFRSIAAFAFVVGDNVVGDRCVIAFLGRTTQECFIYFFLDFFFTLHSP